MWKDKVENPKLGLAKFDGESGTLLSTPITQPSNPLTLLAGSRNLITHVVFWMKKHSMQLLNSASLMRIIRKRSIS